MVLDRLKDKKAFIFDFDGTLFHLFTTFNFHDELIMLDNEFKRLGFKFPDTWNPFEAFKIANNDNNPNRLEALMFADRLLSKTELRYVNLGTPVKGAIELLDYLIKNNYKVSIATNNSPLCVKGFLDKYLNGTKIPTRGRIGDHPELLKPNPWMLDDLILELGCSKDEVVFIGDHPRDRECAIACGIDFQPVAPADYKMERMLKILPREEILVDLSEMLNLIR